MAQYLGTLVGRMCPTGWGSVSLECPDSLLVGRDVATPIAFMLHELITNAMKHAARPGSVAVRVTRRDDERHELQGRDDGPDLPPDWQERAAERLGLTLVRAFVEQLGGSLELHTDVGTVVTVSFPGTLLQGGERAPLQP